MAPEVGAELGVIRMRTESDIASPMVGLANLPGEEAVNFRGVPRPVQIGGEALYRIFETLDPNVRGAQPNGSYWSRGPYQSESAWRSGAAVQRDWNAGIYQGIWSPAPQYAWGGRAAAQAIESLSREKWGFNYGWINKGGDYQFYVPNSRSVVQPLSVVVTQPAPWRK